MKPLVALATGDPAGIGPEIAIKAALDPRVQAACRTVIVSDPALLARHAAACGLDVAGLAVRDAGVDTRDVETGKTSAAAGRAAVAFVETAVRLAMAGDVDAVVAAPQNETSIALAGIPFDGHPSFVARTTGTPDDDVYMMLCFGDVKISHATLHQSVRAAIEAISRERVARVIRVTHDTLRKLGITEPRICVGGLNPHAGEGGLFGREEIEIIAPAVADAKAQGIDAEGPFGADTMFHRKGVDAFVVMLHDQGHIAAKLLAPNATAALTIGTPILFSSVAHGSAHDIAGRGIADATAMVDAVLRMARVGKT
jgi:4-hydroxythreonine-4-phosphate dehydrogenase